MSHIFVWVCVQGRPESGYNTKTQSTMHPIPIVFDHERDSSKVKCEQDNKVKFILGIIREQG